MQSTKMEQEILNKYKYNWYAKTFRYTQSKAVNN